MSGAAGMRIYASVLTCEGREESLARTLASVAATPWTWTVHCAPALADGMESNRLGYLAVLAAAKASGADWLLSVEDDVSLAGDPREIETLAILAWTHLRYIYLGDREQPAAMEPVCGVGAVKVRRLTPAARGLQAFLLRADAIPATLALARDSGVGAIKTAIYSHCRRSWAGAYVVAPLFTERRASEPSLIFPSP